MGSIAGILPFKADVRYFLSSRISLYAAAVDHVAVKRLVRGLIVDFGLPCELLDVAGSESIWSVTIRDSRRRVLQLDVHDSAPSSMRNALMTQLEALLND